VALKSENLPMGWKEAIYTYPSSIVYEIHGYLTQQEALCEEDDLCILGPLLFKPKKS
jgi:hypothetical protein